MTRKLDQKILFQTGKPCYTAHMEPTTMLLVHNPVSDSQWWSGPYLVSQVPGVIKQYAEYGYLIKDAR